VEASTCKNRFLILEISPLGISGSWLAESKIWEDGRGNFREWFQRSEIFEKTGVDFSVAQSNISVSRRGVLRGIHYSLSPEGQSKWVTCVRGRIIDVVVDIRPTSPTFKKYIEVELAAGDGRAVLIESGLGHGFIALEDESTVSYLLSSLYSPSDEYEINPLDIEIDIDWHLDLVGGSGLILSPKDANAPSLSKRFDQGKLPL